MSSSLPQSRVIDRDIEHYAMCAAHDDDKLHSREAIGFETYWRERAAAAQTAIAALRSYRAAVDANPTHP